MTDIRYSATVIDPVTGQEHTVEGATLAEVDAAIDAILDELFPEVDDEDDDEVPEPAVPRRRDA